MNRNAYGTRHHSQFKEVQHEENKDWKVISNLHHIEEQKLYQHEALPMR